MGWWSASRRTGGIVEMSGEEEQGLVWGDVPADILDVAIRNIRAVYREDWGREPTAGELRSGLEFSLGGLKDQESVKKLDQI